MANPLSGIFTHWQTSTAGLVSIVLGGLTWLGVHNYGDPVTLIIAGVVGLLSADGASASTIAMVQTMGKMAINSVIPPAKPPVA
jgi:hypothetical protein